MTDNKNAPGVAQPPVESSQTNNATSTPFPVDLADMDIALEKALTINHIITDEYFGRTEPEAWRLLCGYSESQTLAFIMEDYIIQTRKLLNAYAKEQGVNLG